MRRTARFPLRAEGSTPCRNPVTSRGATHRRDSGRHSTRRRRCRRSRLVKRRLPEDCPKIGIVAIFGYTYAILATPAIFPEYPGW
jgi:hypothetical protein